MFTYSKRMVLSIHDSKTPINGVLYGPDSLALDGLPEELNLYAGNSMDTLVGSITDLAKDPKTQEITGTVHVYDKNLVKEPHHISLNGLGDVHNGCVVNLQYHFAGLHKARDFDRPDTRIEPIQLPKD